jgi:hypothetical protein
MTRKSVSPSSTKSGTSGILKLYPLTRSVSLKATSVFPELPEVTTIHT